MSIDEMQRVWGDGTAMRATNDTAEVHDLESFAFFAGCSTDQLRGLAPHFHAKKVPRYVSLQQEGTPATHVFFVRQGEVLLQKEVRAGAEPARLSIVRAGELFGFGEIMLRACYTTALALTPLWVYAVRKEDFLQFVLAIPLLRDRLLTSFSEIVRILIHKTVAGSGIEELALYLHHLAHENGKREKGRIRIQTKVNQPDIASVLNLSREHVTRLFAQLRKQRVVFFNRGFPIIDPAWLDRMTASDRDLADSLQYRDIPRVDEKR